mgnify:CR=1 FL=1
MWKSKWQTFVWSTLIKPSEPIELLLYKICKLNELNIDRFLIYWIVVAFPIHKSYIKKHYAMFWLNTAIL